MPGFNERENEWKASFTDILTRFVVGQIEADFGGQQAFIEMLKDASQEENLELETKVSIMDTPDLLELTQSMPMAVTLDSDKPAVVSSRIKMSLNVEASTLDAKTSSKSGKVKVGSNAIAGAFGIGLEGSMAVNKEHKRTSDYRSTVEVELEMGRVPVSEGLRRIMDGHIRVMDLAMRINEALVTRKFNEVAQEVGLATPPPSEQRA